MNDEIDRETYLLALQGKMFSNELIEAVKRIERLEKTIEGYEARLMENRSFIEEHMRENGGLKEELDKCKKTENLWKRN